MDSPPIAVRTAQGRQIIAATVLASSMAMLDGTVVNVALPRIADDLGAGVSGLQWVISGYTLTLAALILVGGSLGDRWGRRRIFLIGTVWFALASLLCGVAVNLDMLIGARLLQGVGAALLTPGSLAIISATIREDDRGTAIGLWSGLGGVASAIGPLLGGWLVESVDWRAVFLINLPLAAAVVWITLRAVPETSDPQASKRFDVSGALLGVVGLAVLTFGLIEAQTWASVTGLAILIAFAVVEARSPRAMVPPSLFSSRVFTAANLVTFAVYAALGGVFFLLILNLQLVSGYSPLMAGLATLPITLLMLLFSSRAGRYAQRHGPRWPMTVGPLIAAAGLLLMLRIGPDAPYLSTVLPAVVVFGIGLTTLVAPLTSAVLDAVPNTRAGIASGVNNAVARTSQLLAVAALPGLAGIGAAALDDPVLFGSGFRTAMLICAGLLVLGALIAVVAIRGGATRTTDDRRTAAVTPHCDVTGPAVEPAATERG